MTGTDVDPYMGRADRRRRRRHRAWPARSAARPTTTYAENIGVMAATRVYSTAAYYVAAVIAILFGLCPKFGALVAATPGGVLGGITVILYGMIGLLGAKIWIENRVDFADPVNMVPIGAGIILAIGPVTQRSPTDFSLAGHRARHHRGARSATTLLPRPIAARRGGGITGRPGAAPVPDGPTAGRGRAAERAAA